jgi:hypothetical protein
MGHALSKCLFVVTCSFSLTLQEFLYILEHMQFDLHSLLPFQLFIR